jgi:type II secretory pathway component PulK
VAALGLLVTLSVLALTFSLRARERRLAVINILESAQARAAAHAAVQHAQARLQGRLDRAREADRDVGAAAPDPIWLVDPWADPGPLFRDTIRLGAPGQAVRSRVTLTDAEGRVDLNRASSEDLRRLLVALRVDAGSADRLSQAIADWRDADELHRARGAERADYHRARLPVLPRNAPFGELRELRDVMGMRPDLYARVRPFLTLNGTGQINLNAAERPVLLSLPGMTEATAGLLLQRRRGGHPIRNLSELTLALPSGPREALVSVLPELTRRVTFETRLIEAEAEGWVEGGNLRARAAGVIARAGRTTMLVTLKDQ